jgi:glycosyltransferase involved in cell wall biosynthesis
LRTIFNLRVNAVIHNPVHAMFLEHREENPTREYVTFVGRLHPSKRLESIVPAVRTLLDQTPGLRACFIGDGPLRGMVERAAGGDPRIEIPGPLPPDRVRARLRRTRIFVSGCETEALGIAYIEALSQGCTVVMPACGGGLEIAPKQIGTSIHLVPLPIGPDAILGALWRALDATPGLPPLAGYRSSCVAAAYLRVDAGQTESVAASACGSVVQA